MEQLGAPGNVCEVDMPAVGLVAKRITTVGGIGDNANIDVLPRSAAILVMDGDAVFLQGPSAIGIEVGEGVGGAQVGLSPGLRPLAESALPIDLPAGRGFVDVLGVQELTGSVGAWVSICGVNRLLPGDTGGWRCAEWAEAVSIQPLALTNIDAKMVRSSKTTVQKRGPRRRRKDGTLMRRYS